MRMNSGCVIELDASSRADSAVAADARRQLQSAHVQCSATMDHPRVPQLTNALSSSCHLVRPSAATALLTELSSTWMQQLLLQLPPLLPPPQPPLRCHRRISVLSMSRQRRRG